MDIFVLILSAATPLLFAAMAGYASERSGVINIGLEGKALMACYLCAYFTSTKGPVIGLIAAIFAATVLSVVHWVLTQKYQMDAIIAGMAINLFAAGSTSFLNKSVQTNQNIESTHSLPLWFFYGSAIVLPVILWFVSNNTRFGVRLRAVGSDPDKARLAGIDPQKVRLLSLSITGLGCGLAGAVLASETNGFTDNMTAGRGYIALAALILGGWRPIPAGVACLGFALATVVRIKMGGQTLMGINVPSEAWTSLPYVVTVLALVFYSGRSKAPAGLGKL